MLTYAHTHTKHDHTGTPKNSWALTQELRDAILEFRRKQATFPDQNRRPIIAAGDTFGETGRGSQEYYLASAFDKIFLQPSGLLSMTGIHSETYFLKGALEKIGAYPQFFK